MKTSVTANTGFNQSETGRPSLHLRIVFAAMALSLVLAAQAPIVAMAARVVS